MRLWMYMLPWMGRRRRLPVIHLVQPLKVMRWWPVAVLTMVVVLVGGATAMWLLGVWEAIPARVPNPDQLRLDRIKTGLAVAAGLAAGVTLLITLRRQALSEHTQRFAQSDALEQRITALYVAAAEQIGSDKPAVRLAGLYALERLGQDNRKLCQTVFDVWCAYLRMPYTPPLDVLRRNARTSPQHRESAAELSDEADEAERRQELEVRLTAQRLIAAHLTINGAEEDLINYWEMPGSKMLSVDLVGAVLVDFDLSNCAIGRASFSGADFHGRTNLRGAVFWQDVDLHQAQFHGNVDLHGAIFDREADLRLVEFHGEAYLGDAQFRAAVDMARTRFWRFVGLGGTQFRKECYLAGVQIHQGAVLDRAEFHGSASFERVQVGGRFEMAGALVASEVLLPSGWQRSDGPSVRSEALGAETELRRVVRTDLVPRQSKGDSGT